MKYFGLILFLAGWIHNPLRGQNPYFDFDWAAGQGGTGSERGRSIASDANANIYTIGNFSGTADFDPGPGLYNLTSSGNQDIFISKLDSSGNFIWVKQMGGLLPDDGYHIKLDATGNIYAAGYFSGVADLDPGAGTSNLISFGGFDIFLLKLDPAGNFLWAKQFGGSSLDQNPSLFIEQNGNVLLTGTFDATADFDPGPGIYNITSFGAQDIFISRLDASGNFIWAKQIGGIGLDTEPHLATDGAGNIFISGTFSLTVDCDPGPVVYNLTSVGSSDSYITILDPAGNFIWAKHIVSTIAVVARKITSDSFGNIYLTGQFNGSVDFDPGTGIFNLVSRGLLDVFVAKFDNSGNFNWARQLGGTDYEDGYGIAVGPNGNVYTTGVFSGYADFDPGPGTYNLYANGFRHIFISVLDPSGNFILARQIGGFGGSVSWGSDLIIDRSENVFITGLFSSTINLYSCFDATGRTGAGSFDIFTAKLNYKTPSVTISASSNVFCLGSAVTFTAIPINESIAPVYQWKVNGNNVGTNSTSYTTNSLVNGDVVSVVLSSACINNYSASSNSITVTVTVPVTTAVTISTPNSIICSGTTVDFTANPVNGGPAPAYQWQVNGINAGNNSPVYSTNNLANGDRVKVIMTSSAVCFVPGTVSSNEITMTVNPMVSPAVNIAHLPSTICYGTLVTFMASPVNGGNNPSYHWQINGSATGTNSQFLYTDKLHDGDVVNCIMTSNSVCALPGSIASNNINIKIDPSLCPKGFYMPTAFTPNNDGINEVCKPLLFGRVVSYRFSLYNRWGQKIFETTDLQKGWDGKVWGANQDSNIFIWNCTYQFNGQAVNNKHGTVVLIH